MTRLPTVTPWSPSIQPSIRLPFESWNDAGEPPL
jgi:hypothetical protein